MNLPTIFAIDGYKLSHRQQYPEGTSFVYGNFTPRSNHYFKTPVFGDNSPLLWLGTQAFIKEWLIDDFHFNFFSQTKEIVCNYFKAVVEEYLGKDAVPMDGIEALHDLGYLPLQIKAIPEGQLVQMKLPVLTIQNTKPEFFWLVNFLETLLSAELWPSTTAATIAFNYRVLCELYSDKTCDDNSHVMWQCHDFAARGNMGMRANGLTGLGHLASFRGTDSVYALVKMRQTYGVKTPEYLYAGSVPATEHSVMCMGEMDGEFETFRRLICDLYPTGIVSIVSDTWDYWQVINDYLPMLKDFITSREGKVVIRPDSGDPVDIICGRSDVTQIGGVWYESKHVHYTTDTRDAPILLGNPEPVPEWEVKGTIERMWEIFGGHVNSKGYRVLDPHIGLIYGDSITLERAETIFRRLAEKGFASSNVVLGVGSYTYQYVTRDTFGFAMKATYGVVNGEGRAIQKNPKTDSGLKKSLKGLLRHSFEDGKWSVKDNVGRIDEQQSDLPTIFLNGEFVSRTDIDVIRGMIDDQVKLIVQNYPKDKL